MCSYRKKTTTPPSQHLLDNYCEVQNYLIRTMKSKYEFCLHAWLHVSRRFSDGTRCGVFYRYGGYIPVIICLLRNVYVTVPLSPSSLFLSSVMIIASMK